MKNLFVFAFAIMMTIGFVACNQESAADNKGTADAAAAKTTATANNANPNLANEINPATPKKVEAPKVDPNLPKTSVDFEKTTLDFGDITPGSKVEDVIKFTNTGENPLIIADAKGTCGCTVPEWPKTPIQPGESSEIKISFSPKGNGVVTKAVTIQANTDPNPTRLTVKANILAPEGGDEAAK